MRPPHVLVAHDDTRLLALATQVLAGAGYRVTPVTEGLRAGAMLSDPAHGFAAAVLGCGMPGVSGPAALALARRRGYGGPAVLVAGEDPDPPVRAVCEP